MARGKVYNIASRLGGAKPVIVIDEDHEFKINTTLPVVVQVQAMIKDPEVDQVAVMEDLMVLTLGTEAYEYIKSKDLPFNELTLIIEVITAAMSGEDLEDIEEAKKDAKKGKGKQKG